MPKTTKCVVARSKLMRVKRSLSVVNCKRHPGLRLSPLHRSQSPAPVRTMCASRRGPPMIPLLAYLPTSAKWTCATRIRWAVDPQRTSLARCHLPAAGRCICDRRSVLPAVLQFALYTPQSLARACFCPPTLSHPFEPGSVLHPPPPCLLFFFFC